MVYILPLNKKDTRKRLEKLLRSLPSNKKGSKDLWSLFFGKIKISEDPVKIQRKLRDEWE
jgi:hypothetical protein